MCIFIPPGGEVSTQVEQTVGFLREGLYPSGPTMKRPNPANGAPQRPQRGLLGNARQMRWTARPTGPSPTA